ncbi:MAG: hypothetical protein MUF68_08185 [Cyclobacteriaceae bacterium]|jgi:hypothetical protein|nr:hypothetical protein [Cyclobacteriaceae bacterium]
MKKILAMLMVVSALGASCAAPKPYYETKKGRKKQEYYNDLYYGKHKPFFKDKNR